MKDLLYKEFRLAMHPTIFIFLIFGVLLLIPSWPFSVAFGYIFLAFMSTFLLGRANQDIFFTVSLPVRKRDTVRARVCAVAVIELLQIIVAIPFAVINNMVYKQGNLAGMNTNFAFFGSVLIMYAIFNLIFLPGFYKTAYKFGVPLMLATIVVAVYAVAVNIAVEIVPTLKTNLDGLGADHLMSQLPVLIAGIVIFALATTLAYKISANHFEKVDL